MSRRFAGSLLEDTLVSRIGQLWSPPLTEEIHILEEQHVGPALLG